MGVSRFWVKICTCCDELSEIRVVGDSQNLKMVDSVLYNKEMTRLIWCSPEKSGSFKMPDTFEIIDKSVFAKHKKLTSITIPGSITKIGNEAFEECMKLKTVTIPNSVTSIGYFEFSHCSALKSIVIPESIVFLKKDILLVF